MLWFLENLNLFPVIYEESTGREKQGLAIKVLEE